MASEAQDCGPSAERGEPLSIDLHRKSFGSNPDQIATRDRIRIGPERRGALNGSMEHFLTVFVNAVFGAHFFRGRQFKQSKAPIRFGSIATVKINSRWEIMSE